MSGQTDGLPGWNGSQRKPAEESSNYFFGQISCNHHRLPTDVILAGLFLEVPKVLQLYALKYMLKIAPGTALARIYR